MSTRPFGASGDAPGSMAVAPRAEPIYNVPGIPGGTLMNVPQAGTRAYGATPMQVGTGAIVSRDAVLAMTAINGRGAGPAGSRASEGLVYAGMKTPGVLSNMPLARTIAGLDMRNPMVAPFMLRTGMRAGATRIS